MYIKERKTRIQKRDPIAKHFTNDVLACTLLQLVGDGILSVAAYVNIFLQGLVEYPEEQEKVHEEIIDVIGPDRQPTMDDKNKLPYTNAFMNEVIRKSDFTPMLPSVECTTETTIRGHRIPKGAVTLPNYWAANHDPETYDEPDAFNPSRFLATPNKPRAELPVLFGVEQEGLFNVWLTGKRACIGETFTTTQAFLFLTSIAQKFKLSKPSEPADNDSVSLTPGHTYILVNSRKEGCEIDLS
ncbi:cytochrome P450 1A1-like [Uloborus diversus]|uniref:cytochrome P450 1A1-like n=1 Tax=Uloborus diversus TaxID=327109 RepID=UPI00240A070C|nr:cytochrome P450 1A1-like [Uloborus diversus]